MISAVTATGIMINPVHAVLIGTQITGRVQSLNADFNSGVNAGDIVAMIDPADDLGKFIAHLECDVIHGQFTA